MDYSKLSDAEINQSITCILNPDAGKMALIGDGSCFYDCGPDGSQFHEIPISDYCNNAADAWRIIVGSRISLTPFDDFKEGGNYIAAKYKPTRDNSKPAEVEFFCCDKPLRAAMIVFLMMQESE